MAVFLTLCSLSSSIYTGRVRRPTKVSRSLVVRKSLPSFSFITLAMTSSADWSWAALSQWSSPCLLAAAFDLAPLPLRATRGGRRLLGGLGLDAGHGPLDEEAVDLEERLMVGEDVLLVGVLEIVGDGIGLSG